MSVDWVGYGYAALIASGGAIGYAKAGLYHVFVFQSQRIICMEKKKKKLCLKARYVFVCFLLLVHLPSQRLKIFVLRK